MACTAPVTDGRASPFGQFRYTELARDPHEQNTLLDGPANVLAANMPLINPSGEVAFVAPPGTQFGNNVPQVPRRTTFVPTTGHSPASNNVF